MSDDTKKNDQKPQGYWLGLGMALGAGAGTGIGVAIDNIGLGIALGAAAGLVFGLLYSARKKAEKDESDTPDSQ